MAETTGGAGTGSGLAGQGGAGAAGVSGQFLAPREVLIVLPGLLLAILLAMLDNLIVSTALPRIVGDLGGVAHLSWVVTAYILASTITTPFYGKLGDMYGRKKFFIVAIVIFLVGSALSGLSQSKALSSAIDCDRPDSTDPTRKITIATMKNLFRPYMSPSLP